jgi:uncharacterized membrane protein
MSLGADTPPVLVTAFGLGLVAGFRSLVTLAVVAWTVGLRWITLEGSVMNFMGGLAWRWGCTIAGVAEIVGDKMPWMPSRKMPPSFLFRIAVGAISGAAMCAARHQSPWGGVVAGMLGAVVGTICGAEARAMLDKALNVPDQVVAVGEDLVAIVGGLILVARM